MRKREEIGIKPSEWGIRWKRSDEVWRWVFDGRERETSMFVEIERAYIHWKLTSNNVSRFFSLPHTFLSLQEAHIVQHLLWKLFHIEQNLTKATESIEEENDKLPGLREKAKEKDAEVEKARKSLAEVQKNVMKMEKNIRRKERDVEEKVSTREGTTLSGFLSACLLFLTSLSNFHYYSHLPSVLQKPNLISLSQTLEHSRQKRTNAKNSIESTTRDLEKRKATEVTLTKALEDTERARDQAVEEQRRAMEKKGMALSKQDLAKYHEL